MPAFSDPPYLSSCLVKAFGEIFERYQEVINPVEIGFVAHLTLWHFQMRAWCPERERCCLRSKRILIHAL
jgi:hypothetical protein